MTSKPLRLSKHLAAAEARVQSSKALWSSLRRVWADVAVLSRERGDRTAAGRAAQELVRCELECRRYERQLALLRGDPSAWTSLKAERSRR